MPSRGRWDQPPRVRCRRALHPALLTCPASACIRAAALRPAQPAAAAAAAPAGGAAALLCRGGAGPLQGAPGGVEGSCDVQGPVCIVRLTFWKQHALQAWELPLEGLNGIKTGKGGPPRQRCRAEAECHNLCATSFGCMPQATSHKGLEARNGQLAELGELECGRSPKSQDPIPGRHWALTQVGHRRAHYT